MLVLSMWSAAEFRRRCARSANSTLLCSRGIPGHNKRVSWREVMAKSLRKRINSCSDQIVQEPYIPQQASLLPASPLLASWRVERANHMSKDPQAAQHGTEGRVWVSPHAVHHIAASSSTLVGRTVRHATFFRPGLAQARGGLCLHARAATLGPLGDAARRAARLRLGAACSHCE